MEPGNIWLQTFLAVTTWSAVVPPPWADVRKNPCASQPRGWLMLYWPQDGKCYTIYKTEGSMKDRRFSPRTCHNDCIGTDFSQRGYPCPETMELSPTKTGSKTIAECKCPPGYASLDYSTTCHKLYTKGPCLKGEYLAPVQETFNKKGQRKGICVKPLDCPDETQVFWPAEGKCYPRYSQGPCFTGTLIIEDKNGVGNCTCEPSDRMKSMYYPRDGSGGGCYQLYTRGPCQNNGELFLPDGVCGCDSHEPHYHPESKGCYELDTKGPCPKGHIFTIVHNTKPPFRAECVCKNFYARHADGVCYRLYTRGPCKAGEVIRDGGICSPAPCPRGGERGLALYVPEKQACYKAGAREPCPHTHRLTYDFDARPSIDGMSFNGKCAHLDFQESVGWQNYGASPPPCRLRAGHVSSGGACHVAGVRGLCPRTHSLAPAGHCRCKHALIDGQCKEPNQSIADYLNKRVNVTS